MHLHAAWLDVTDSELARLRATLSAGERARADALALPIQRRRAVAERGLRRAVLAAALKCEPEAIEYAVDSRGKPHLAQGGPDFSVSHSDAVALYAVSESAPVGVDIEAVPRQAELQRLAERLLAPRERAAWEATAPPDRATALYACWTRKEAHGKALGTGLVFPLNEIELWAGDERPVRHDGVVVHAVDLAPIATGLEAAGEGRQLAAAVAVQAGDGQQVTISAPSLVPRAGA